MAISTNGTIITRLAGALYNEYLSNASYTELNTTPAATVAANMLSSDFAGKTDAQIAKTILANLGLSSITGLDNWVAAQLTGAGTTAAAKGAKLVSMLNDFAMMTADVTYGSYAKTFNDNTAASLANSQKAGSTSSAFATSAKAAADKAAAEQAAADKAAADKAAAEQAAADKAAADKVAAEKAAADKVIADKAVADKVAADKVAADKVIADAAFADTLILKSTVQTTTGSAGDDTFTAALGTLNAGDKINGGNGIDTLNLTASGTVPTQTATSLVSVEVINITASPNPVSIDMTGVTGVTSINSVASVAGATVAVSNVGAAVNSTMSDTSTGLTIGYTTAVTAATALTDSATLTLNKVGAGSSYTATGIENLTVNSTGGANVLGNVGSNGLAGTGLVKLTLTGDQALTINGTVGGTTITTLDASAATGAITVATGAGTGTTANSNVGITVTAPTAATAGLFTATTGSQRDVVTLGAGNAVLDTGAGNDTITSGGGTNTITPGSGNDTINVTTGKDTIRFADVGNANADSVTNFSVANTVMQFATSTVPTATTLAGAGTFGGLTTATPGVPALVGVAGTGTTNAFAGTNYQEISAGTAVLGTSAVVELTGVFTNGIAQGVVDGLGVSATTGITTTPTGKFLLVTYSVGNTAQVWSYGGDGTGTGTVNTDIDAGELSLVATLQNVAVGSLGVANFGVYASGTATATAVSATGGSITVTAPLTTITSAANAAGQLMTAANDVITVNTGILPTGVATATSGLTILDDSSTDNDSLTATVLGDFALGTLLVGIETVNLNYLVAGNAFNAASRMPGTTTFNFTGTQNTGAITAAPATTTIGLGAGRAGLASVDLAAAGPYSVTLNGAGVAPTTATAAPTTAAIATNGTTATITATGSNFISTNAQANLLGANSGLKTLTGTGSVDISGASADFGTLNLVTSATYSGSLTLRPSDAGAMDLTGTTAALGTVNGVRTIDYTAVATPAPTITLDAANGTPATVIRTANATSNAAGGFGAVSVTQAGTGITDAVTITVANATTGNTSGIGAVTAVGVETLTLNLGGTATSATKAVAGVTMDVTAAPQALIVTSSALATTLGTVTADSINTTGVAGTLTAAFTAGIASAVFTGSTTNASFITGTSNNDLITTGSAADAIYVPAGGTGVVNLTGGLGNDTYSLANTTQAGASITDTGGTDTLILAGTASNTATMNNGATFAAIGIDQINTNGTAINTVAPGQIGAQTINAIAGAGTVPVFTLASAGALNVSGVTTTAIAAANLPLSAAGVAVAQTLALTGFTLNGSANADTITGSALADNITGGGGADVLVGGNGTNTFNFASAANLAAATVTGGTGTDTIAITGDAVTLVDTNFTATHTSVETLTLGTGITSTTLGAAANTAGITTVNTGVGQTTIASTGIVTLTVNPLAIVAGTALILTGATNYIVSQAGTAFDTLTATGSTGTIAATFGDDNGNAIAIAAGNGNMTVTGGAVGDTITVTGLATAGQTFTGSVSAFNITAGAGAQTIATGAAASVVNGAGGDDAITLGAANAVVDTIVWATGGGIDTVTNFLQGTGGDQISAGVSTGGAAPTLVSSADAATGLAMAGTDEVLILRTVDGTFADITAVGTRLAAGNESFAASDTYYIVWTATATGLTNVARLTTDATANVTFDAADTLVNMIVLTGTANTTALTIANFATLA